MYAKTYGASLHGLTGTLLEIECYITNGLPSFTILGIPASSAASSRERIRSALKQLGFLLPPSRITVNVRPLDAREIEIPDPSRLDLPIALGILACERAIPSKDLSSTVWAGELSLSGELKPMHGCLSVARCLAQYMEESTNLFPRMDQPSPPPLSSLYLPFSGAREAALCPSISAYGLRTLEEAVNSLRHYQEIAKAEPLPSMSKPLPSLFDQVYGQGIAKRVITLSAAGMHNLLMIGPPGCGKTMLAQTLPSLLPPLTLSEQLEVTEIYSAKQMLEDTDTLISNRPFRSPHHSISVPSLIGGGRIPMPGEISLAHHGVLFLDEFPELSRAALESLREPLENHQVHISRLSSTYTFPADILLLSGMNPCPCGYYPDKTRCKCSERAVRDYYGKIDSPLLDRMDLILRMENVKPSEIEKSVGLTFQEASALVHKAHEMQEERFHSASFFNSRMDVDDISRFCTLHSKDRDFLNGAVDHFHLSMRGYHKLLRVARTIADMEGSDRIRRPHLLEALQYRTTRFE